MIGRWAALVVAMLVATSATAQDDAPLGLTDLAAEHDALTGKGDASPPRPATFRDLWERPDEFRNRRVAVSGRVVRSFRQDAVGSFPALVESWIEQPSGDLLCVVFPAPPRETGVATGASVTFTGTYLRRVRYKAEGDRLAPLIVGPAAPVVEKPAPAATEESPRNDWPGPLAIVGLFVGLAAIGGLLAWRSLAMASGPRRRRRSQGPRPEPGPDPEFLEPEPTDGDSP
ncbi:hypothetical protein [Paludisphaera rhizosphaerae]|uniref:hypothetical protein n=1 Tax=Paludisphaera rhizosphaerae TaxID=2711216 RepID=UPI0013ED50D3|nr:hypothetical protein [Paludisphaera rhizosphaerae]